MSSMGQFCKMVSLHAFSSSDCGCCMTPDYEPEKAFAFALGQVRRRATISLGYRLF